MYQHTQLSVASAVWTEETANSFTKDHDWREIKFPCNSAYKRKDVIDIDGIITEFACLKGTHLALCL